MATVGEIVENILDNNTPRAPAFIVTIYGDAVEPRGGTLWMGNLVSCCAAQGISESLVRTAVSRLVSAGKLVGERIGRKSYYWLTDQAKTEFRNAARILYMPSPPASSWLIALNAPVSLPDGWAMMGQGAAIAPDRDDISVLRGPLLSAETIGDPSGLPEYIAERWDLQTVADRYRQFVARFEALGRLVAVSDGKLDVSGEHSLALRLQLVHHYRMAALKDPRLPRTALPEDWPAVEARQLFVRSYLALTRFADAHIGGNFHNPDGLLPAATEAINSRIDSLATEKKL